MSCLYQYVVTGTSRDFTTSIVSGTFTWPRKIVTSDDYDCAVAVIIHSQTTTYGDHSNWIVTGLNLLHEDPPEVEYHYHYSVLRMHNTDEFSPSRQYDGVIKTTAPVTTSDDVNRVLIEACKDIFLADFNDPLENIVILSFSLIHTGPKAA